MEIRKCIGMKCSGNVPHFFLIMYVKKRFYFPLSPASTERLLAGESS